MANPISRILTRLAEDPVLRHWLLLRALRLTPGEPAFQAHRPPCLGTAWNGLAPEDPKVVFPCLPDGPPRGKLILRLPGLSLDVEPGGEAEVVARAFDDPETQLGLHRFAWVALMKTTCDVRWVGAFWKVWRARFGTPDDGWAWHPYTAAERALNLLTFARRHGLPGAPKDTLALLAAHAPVIADRLEWFGEHHTSNHLFNNGRGLFRLGLELGLPQATQAGAAIITAELGRIFRVSGVLREGSSHYHLLLTRSLADLWLTAQAHGRPEAEALEKALRRAAAILPRLMLPSGLPLVGDISPDCPPSHLFCLLPGGDRHSGWMDLLTPEQRLRLATLLDQAAPAESLAADGWLDARFGDWSGLWHADPDGWSHMPGHGHQDCGGFVLDFESEPVFVDPGRGSYGVAGEADPLVSGLAHNILSVDGADPYPPNKPYFAPSFRRRLCGAPPVLERRDGEVFLRFEGFSRLKDVGAVERSWRFQGRRLELEDKVEGRGVHSLTRRLHTPCRVERKGEALLLLAPGGRRFTVTAPGARLDLDETTAFTAYGEGGPLTRLTAVVEQARLPWTGLISISAD